MDIEDYKKITTAYYRSFNQNKVTSLDCIPINVINTNILSGCVPYIHSAILISSRKSDYTYTVTFEKITSFQYELKFKHNGKGLHIILSTYGYHSDIENGKWLYLPVGIIDVDVEYNNFSYYTHLVPLPDKEENIILNRLLYKLYNYLDSIYGTQTISENNIILEVE